MKLVTLPCSLVACALLILAPRSCRSFSYNLATLTPNTSPTDVVTANLLALQNRDLQTAFDLVSPAAQADINYDVIAKEQGWRCYGYLMEHQESEILLETTSNDNDEHKLLVRVVPSQNDDDDDTPSHSSRTAVKEYWWTLSRCQESGCFMVDAIGPAGTIPLDWSNYFF